MKLKTKNTRYTGEVICSYPCLKIIKSSDLTENGAIVLFTKPGDGFVVDVSECAEIPYFKVGDHRVTWYEDLYFKPFIGTVELSFI